MDPIDPIGSYRDSPPDKPLRPLDCHQRPLPTHRETEDRLCEYMDVKQSLGQLPLHLLRIADLLSRGYSEPEIAEHLGVSRRQVRHGITELADFLHRDWGLA